MGQTLSHGVYLPNEGERNCYAGLASNWQILNTAVGAIAEKAPLVHTHGNITNDGKIGSTANLPLITGTGGAITAGAFGNQANTFCEGNDSRLSDARTPVAHTHTKADITNLFNSANTWTDTNTYTVTGDVPIKITNNKDATNPSATEMKDIRFSDVNGKIIGGVRHSLESDGTSKIHLYSRSYSLNGSSNSNHGLLIINNKQTGIREVQSESNLIPSADNTYNLGTSTNKWKTLNGINPGALSLPRNANSTSFNIDTTNWTTDGSIIAYTPLLDGWIYINVRNDDTNGDSFIIFDDGVSGFGTSVFGNKGLSNVGVGLLCLMMPVNKNNGINIRIKSPGIISARLYPCNGNV